MSSRTFYNKSIRMVLDYNDAKRFLGKKSFELGLIVTDFRIKKHALFLKTTVLLWILFTVFDDKIKTEAMLTQVFA